jgi:hypothetical protein
LLSEDWSMYLDDCERIYISCGHSSSKLLYNSTNHNHKNKKNKNGAIDKNNPKVINIPFQSLRPTLEEVKRICRCCATCLIVPPSCDEDGDSDRCGKNTMIAPTIRRGIPKFDILPMLTKKRKSLINNVMNDGYGEVLIWEIQHELLIGWRNSIEDIEDDEGGSFLYF